MLGRMGDPSKLEFYLDTDSIDPAYKCSLRVNGDKGAVGNTDVVPTAFL